MYTVNITSCYWRLVLEVLIMGILTGHAIPTLGGLADHTYVTCLGGYAWPCWGRSAGGRAISSGPGSTAQADCFSQTNSHAGLIYGITGVCHQTANRILWPSQVTVRKAKLYWVSHLIYGTYGTSLSGWLKRLNNCSIVQGEIPECNPRAESEKGEQAVSGYDLPEDELDKTYLNDLQALYDELPTTSDPEIFQGPNISAGFEVAEPAFMAREVELAANQLLGADFSRDAIRGVQEVQASTAKEIVAVGQAVAQGEMYGGEMAKTINGIAQNALNFCAEILGNEAYIAYMGIEPRETFNLVDQEIAVQIYR